EKVGKNAISAAYVASKIEKALGKRKREINLPVQLAVVAKLRALFPRSVDFVGRKFFNYK
ncbi:MAG TPA: oxidoreductase, partial [Lactococcus sp.]|nr:oxidoreductase [Lactococcus sp.]